WARTADPSRAFTHNKGILNGIDAVCVATGQDWRAVETALTSSATKKNGSYEPLTKYVLHRDYIEGIFSGMIPVGTVGGFTQNPIVKMNLALAGVTSAIDLAAIIGAIGLAQNFAALLCLTNEGITAARGRVDQR
ncbi:MAG: 3-hydroxy-3-methylglutaryl-CoA reductase, partial [Patescibacteria group bacterium]